MSKDKLLLLSEFKKALNRNAAKAYSNLDGSFTKQFDFFVHRYEEIMKITGTHIPPHIWSYHRIGLITSGQASYTCGIYRFTARKNTLLIIPARMITTSDWTSDGKGFTTLFKPDYLLRNHLSFKSIATKTILQHSVHPYLHLTDKQADLITEIFKTILKEDEADDAFNNELIALKIIELLILCERFYTQTHKISINKQLIQIHQQFSELLEKHFREQRSVAFYASKLHIHPNHLNSVIKSSAGITAKQSIQNRVILEAKYLLHATNLSIKEISSKLGFDDPNYFTVFFTKAENMAPAAYRSSFV